MKVLIRKTWQRCKSFGHARKKVDRVAPDGCFSVYVGEGKQRFMIRAECANHPLFRILLEEAELEYGYENPGPILLPCNVENFRMVLAEMEVDRGCSFAPTHLSPSRIISVNKL